jgi:type I restriction enzyme, S subunit
MNPFPDSWSLRPINEVCAEVVDCINKTAPIVDEPTDFKMIRTTNIKDGRVDLEQVNYVTEKTFLKWSRRVAPRKYDVILTREAPLGEVGMLRARDKVFLGQRTVLYRANNFDLNQWFLYYSLIGPVLQGQIRSLGSGSTVEHLRVPHAEALKVPLPPLPQQKKIAAILAAYDELIENDKRRMALLEKMAEEIYREWFVRLRFPGSASASLVKGIPQGWRVCQLRELADINPSSVDHRNSPESILYVDIGSVSTNSIEEKTPYLFRDAPGRARRLVQHGDIIWSSVRPANRAYCLLFEPPQNLVVSTGFAVIRPNPSAPFTFLFFAVTSDPFVDQMTAVAKGAAYPAASFEDFEKAKILVPTDGLLEAFHQKTEPIFRSRALLQQQIESLRKTRDLLLPRLISGKLSVENSDIRFPSCMNDGATSPTLHESAQGEQ